MSIQQMREFLIDQYRGSLTWAARVKKMPDNQVLAIYYNIKKRLWHIRHRRRSRRGPAGILLFLSSGPRSLLVRSSSHS